MEASDAGRGLSNINLSKTMRQLARAQAQTGATRAAQDTLKQMLDTFRAKSLRPHVMERIREEAAEVRAKVGTGAPASKRLKKETRPQDE